MLLQELQDRLRSGVGLREHGGAGLQEDLVLGEVDHLEAHVGVDDRRLRRREVLGGHLKVRDGRLEPVLDRTELATVVGHLARAPSTSGLGAGVVGRVGHVDAGECGEGTVGAAGDPRVADRQA